MLSQLFGWVPDSRFSPDLEQFMVSGLEELEASLDYRAELGCKRANKAVLHFRGLLRWWVSSAAEVGT